MRKLSPDTVLKRCADVRYRRVLDEAVVVRQQAAETLVLNDVAAAVLERCDGSTPLGSILEQLNADYLVDAETLAKDVHRFVRELIASGVLEAEADP